MKRRVLVCGATGFIGRNAVERFTGRADAEVVAVYHKRPPFEHPEVTWVQADLTKAVDVERVVEGVDIIVQAAATTSGSKDIVTRPYLHVTDNAVMNSLLFRAAFEKGVRHVLFFSCTVMYPSGDLLLKEGDFDANEEIHPRYFGVGWTKVYTEKLCEFYSRIGDTKYTVIRHSNVYGPHDKFDLERSHVFGATITKVMTAEREIVVWGSGEEARDFLYVDDLMDFLDLALVRQHAPHALYNVGSGIAVSVRDLVDKIVVASGRELEVRNDLSQPTIPTSLCLDCGKARQELGWSPKVSLKEGIRRTIAWWRAHVGKESPVLRDI
jgi:nucleoside-diphosphate-sugar epimerase